MAITRYRSTRAKHWRTGSLTDLTRHPAGGARFVAEVIDDRTGNTRTLDTHRHHLEIHQAGDWVTPDTWAATTAPLFTLETDR
jgi:hypothetical protein